MALRPLYLTPRPSFLLIALGRRVGSVCVIVTRMSNSDRNDYVPGAVVRLNSDVREKPQLMSLSAVDRTAGTGTVNWFDYNNGLRTEQFPLAVLTVVPGASG